jgi:hypothetical protein
MLAVWTDGFYKKGTECGISLQKIMRKSLICRAFLIFVPFSVLWGEKVPPLGFIRD